MKKFLSLVLALAMTLSLVTISAGAKDFADESDIDYDAAVDVISELGIVSGYGDNSFRPDGLLTRGAAAKIICNLILGPTTASALQAGTAPFKDVPTTNTFAGYIAYCAQQGIISGYGDGTFQPTGSLTGNAFMKMLLGALGYSSSIEGYTGANWQVNVVKQAIGIGLDDGNDNFIGSNPVTRGEAALYAYNMLQATMVEYDSTSTIVVGDITINTASSRKDVDNNATVESIKKDGKMQFAERYFDDLKKSTGDSDEFNRPATTWRLGSKTIGTYADTPDLVYTSKVESGEIYSDLGLTDGIAASKITGYRNGTTAAFNTEWGTVAIRRGDDDSFGGNGALTEVWYDDDADTVTISVIDTYAGEITGTYDATSSRDAYAVVSAKTPGAPAGNFDTTAFDVDDIVTYNYSNKSGDTGVYNVALAETVTGELNGYTEEKNVTVGGHTYSGSLCYKDNITDTSFGSYKTYEVTLVLDPYGYVAFIDTDNAASNYAVVIKIKANAGDFNDTPKATLLMTDGETVEVNLTSAAAAKIGTGTANTIQAGDIVRYSVSSNNKYNLDLLADWTVQSGISGTIVKNGQSSINLFANIWDGSTSFSGTATVANGKTIFLVKTLNGGEAEYTAYAGIANVPDITTSSTVTATAYCKTSNIATVVYVDATANATVSNSNSDVVFINSTGTPKATYDGTVKYYVYDAIVNDEIVDDFKASNDISTQGLYTTVSYDKNGVATLGGQLTETGYNKILNAKGGMVTSGGTVRAEDGVIGLGGNFYTYADDVDVFVVNDEGDIIRSSIGSIGTDTANTAYFKLSDGEISTLVVVMPAATPGGVGGGSYAMTNAVVRESTGTKGEFAISFNCASALAATDKVTITITKKNASEGDALVGTNTVNAVAGAAQNLKTGINIPANGNYIAEIVVKNASGAVIASGTTASTYVANTSI